MGATFYEGFTTMDSVFDFLKSKILNPYATGANNWTLVNDTTNSVTFKMTTSIGSVGYIRFSRITGTAQNKNNHLMIQYSDSWDDVAKTLLNPSPESYWSFGINEGADDSNHIGVWARPSSLTMKYFLSISNDSLAIMIKGDPTFSFTKYYNGFLYFGQLESFDSGDTISNIAFTCSSTNYRSNVDMPGISVTGDKPPTLTINLGGLDISQLYFTTNTAKTYGINTSKGMTDISVLRTKSELSYQSHYPSILANSEAVDAVANSTDSNQWFFSASKYSKKYHASPIYVVHPFDGYRGFLKNVIAINPQGLIEADILRENVGTDANPIYEEYKLVMVHANSPNTFMSKLDNDNYILGIRIN